MAQAFEIPTEDRKVVRSSALVGAKFPDTLQIVAPLHADLSQIVYWQDRPWQYGSARGLPQARQYRLARPAAIQGRFGDPGKVNQSRSI
jgi:hypothetical protein